MGWRGEILQNDRSVVGQTPRRVVPQQSFLSQDSSSNTDQIVPRMREQMAYKHLFIDHIMDCMAVFVYLKVSMREHFTNISKLSAQSVYPSSRFSYREVRHRRLSLETSLKKGSSAEGEQDFLVGPLNLASHDLPGVFCLDSPSPRFPELPCKIIVRQNPAYGLS